MGDTTNKLTVCLLKEHLQADEEIVVEGCEVVQLGAAGTFYTAPSYVHDPDWVQDFFLNKLGLDVEIHSAAARGVLLTTGKAGDVTRRFALLFGYGRHLLREDAIEERFGLKVVLNSVDPNSLRSIDKLNLGSFAKQSREQIGREGGAASFGIDIEQDLVRAVTGRSALPVFGKTISGRDAFVASAKFNMNDIGDLLSVCLSQYQSKAYQEEFDWIDQLEDIRSPSQLAILNAKLVERIAAGDFERIWITPPDIVDWSSVKAFKYAKPKQGAEHDDLSMADLVAAANGKPITLEWLNGTQIFLISAKDDEAHEHWRAYTCIYAEIAIEGSLYVLNAGKWYKVADDFTKSVNQDFEAIPTSDIAAVPYNHNSEASYNAALTAHLPGALCLDGDLVPYGGGKSKIEICDVMTPAGQFIHVKRYSGSSQMSHLFSQGAVSAELFATEAEFRKKINEKLPLAMKLGDISLRPDTSKYEVVYAIISRSEKPLDLPFFSKVTVRNAARTLRGLGYKFSKLKIAVAGA